MKLCLIFPFFPPNAQIGGIEDYSRILVDKFRDMGIDTHVITADTYRGDDPRVHTVGGPEWGRKELRNTLRCIAEKNFDMVLMQYTPVSYGFGLIFKCLPLCLRLRGRAPFFVTTFHTLVGGRWVSKFNALLLTAFSRRVISTNEDLTFLFRKYFWMFRFKLDEIPIGSNVRRVVENRDEARQRVVQRLKLDPDAVWLTNFGFTIPNKGVEDLFEAFAALKNQGRRIHLIMVSALREGDGPYRESLKKLAREREIDGNITWINESTQEDVSMYLTASDMFVVPYKDGICTRRGTLMAGIVHHLPIVSTRPQVPSPYFKNEQNVLLVDRGSPQQLARAIQRLIDDPALREKLRDGIAKVENMFDWDRIAERVIKLYGQQAKPLRERIRYPLKMIVETCEHIGWSVVLGPKRPRFLNGSPPAKILVLQLNSIGDVVMSTPALRGLKKKFPEAAIHTLTLPHTRALWENEPAVGRMYSCDSRFWRKIFHGHPFRSSLLCLRELRDNRYDYCYDFSGTYESAMIAAVLRIPVTIGPKAALRRGLFRTSTGRYYSRTIETTQKHIARRNAEIAGASTEDTDQEDVLTVKDEDKREAESFLKAKGLVAGGYAVIHPGAKWPPKRWPEKSFAVLTDLISDKGLRVLLVGGKEDHALLETIRGQAKTGPCFSCGELGFGALTDVIRQAAVFIGNDSGVGHIAAGTQTPTVVLFGPTNPETCSPIGRHVRVVHNKLPCWPCVLYYRRSHCQMGDNLCMTTLNPETVLHEVQAVCE